MVSSSVTFVLFLLGCMIGFVIGYYADLNDNDGFGGMF
jgi:uncharacterized membrane protein SpoIIM required for sporulation